MTSPAGTMRPSLDAAIDRAMKRQAQDRTSTSLPPGLVTPTWLLPEPELLPEPDPAAVAAESTPAWVATCQTVPGVACPKCGATCDAPCRTATGKVTAHHKGRVIA